ncbi:hypothetical protein GCM10025862_39460 [Arsenicicoccus piscis]|uniref:Uncharacterized protein n=1 Tax=Arsenicicoccus piscis TaxID=673954 RepID=A0ABQ6HHE8_9MICO|nr:hypothetical protein GCM10025862_00750 [Arsenicicoccus piscis]GMA21925.1 hypothetical protein GCM10025862_39460 [Arsenicicoccus piscis]
MPGSPALPVASVLLGRGLGGLGDGLSLGLTPQKLALALWVLAGPLVCLAVWQVAQIVVGLERPADDEAEAETAVETGDAVDTVPAVDGGPAVDTGASTGPAVGTGSAVETGVAAAETTPPAPPSTAGDTAVSHRDGS